MKNVLTGYVKHLWMACVSSGIVPGQTPEQILEALERTQFPTTEPARSITGDRTWSRQTDGPAHSFNRFGIFCLSDRCLWPKYRPQSFILVKQKKSLNRDNAGLPNVSDEQMLGQSLDHLV